MDVKDHQNQMDDNTHSFLVGGGEMGERTRAFDWSQTPVGTMADWPHGLKTAVQIMLGSRYPMFVWWGPKLINLYNDAYIPILGKRHPDALGKPAAEIWSEIWTTIGPQAEAVLKKGQATWNEEILLTMERNLFLEETYFTFSYSPAPASDGSVGGVFCACTEDTSRVLSDRRLQTLRELAARTTDEAKSADESCQTASAILADNQHDLPFTLLYLLDGDGQRARLVGLTGVSRDMPACPPVVELQDENSPWPFRQVMETGEGVEIRDLPSGFAEVSVGIWPEPPQLAVVLPLAKPGQTQVAGFMVAGVSPRLPFDDDYRGFFDLTAGQISTAIANARAYEEERKRAETLAELDRAKTTFFSNVSHEFRTPLTLMLGPVEDMLSRSYTELSPAAKGQLEVVNRNGLRLLRLVNSLLDFSRIEAGRVRAAYQPTDLAAHTTELASVFRAACERAGLRMTVDCPTLDEPVFVDRDMWEKIVLNLLSNAFKFTYEGEITLILRQVGSKAELQVRDTGTGIPAEEMPRLFERFHRIENAQGRTHEGSGIGLALVQELVKLHGGSIAAESVMGEGTTFTVTLPLGSSHLPPDQIGGTRSLTSTGTGATPYVEEALRWLPDEHWEESPSELPTYDEPLSVPAVCSEPDQDAGRPRVLVADDNADMRQYVVRLLAEQYSVMAVTDGEAALEAALQQPPDLILSDVMMPRLDGFGLLRELRAEPRTQAIPVIMLSARAGEESRVEGMEAGADDYLVKPFSARELLARVGAHLQMARLRRESEQEVRESEERLRMALAAARMVTWQFDPFSGKIAVSTNAAELFGLPPSMSLEHVEEAFALLHPDDVERHRATVQTAVEQCDNYLSQFRIIRPDNEQVIWLEDRGQCVSDETENTLRLVGVVMDITERKRAEEELQNERDLLSVTLASIGDAVITTDIEGRITNLNGVAETLTGWTNTEAVGKPLDAVFHIVNEETRQSVENPATKALREGVMVGLANHTVLIAKDGTERPIDDSAAPIRSTEEKIVGCVLVFRDVTERRKAEMELEASEHRLRAIVETAMDGIINIDQSGKVLEFNPAAEKTFGYSRSEVVGRELSNLIIPANLREKHNQGLANYLATGEGPVFGKRLELPALRADGSEFPVEVAITQVPVSGSSLFTGFIRDISERKRAEQYRNARHDATHVLTTATTLSEATYGVLSAICRNLDWELGFFWAVDEEKEGLICQEGFTKTQALTTAFQSASRQIEFGRGEGLPGSVWAKNSPEWILDVTQQSTFSRAVSAATVGLHSAFACPVIFGGKTLGVIEFFTKKLKEPDGDLLEMAETLAGHLGQFIERQLAEAQLEKRMEELADFFENATLGLHWVGPDGVILRANRAELNLLGYSNDEYIGHHISEFHADEDVICDILRRLQDGEELHDYEARLQCKDGSIKEVLINSNVLWEGGQFIHTRCFTRDITAQKRAEEEVRASEERFRNIFACSNDAIFVVDPERDAILDINPKACTMLGYTREELLSLSISVVHPQEMPKLQVFAQEVFARGHGWTDELTCVTKTGCIIPAEISASRFVDAVNRSCLLAIVRDITERKQAEAALRQQEQQYRSIFESTSDAVLIFDYHGRLIEVNPAACAMHGYAHEELVGMHGTQVVHPDDHHKFADFVQQVTAGNEYHVEGTHVRKNGELISIQLAGTSFVFAGRPALLAVIRDISEERKAVDALRKNEQRLRFIMDSMPQKIFTATPKGDVDYFNPSWMAFTGESFETIRDWGWSDIIHPDDVDENVRVWQHSIDTGEPFQFEHRFRRADGEYRWHISRALPMRDEEGQIVMWIGSNTEIHEPKSLQEELRQVAAELSEANRRKTEFLATLGHELRNPLAPIRTGLEAMKMIGDDPEALGEIRNTMERQVQQMVRLIDDLLDISRITQDKMELRICRVVLQDVIQSAVEATKPFIDEAGHELTVTVPEQAIYLDGDPNRLAQVFSNLLNNSAKYTAEGGQIWFTVEQQDNHVVVTVKDNGLGIPADMLDGIFEMFTQIDRPLEKGYTGLGIGLTLVKRLVDMHNGSIEVRSDGPDKGSEFSVRLPILVESLAEESASIEQEIKATSLRILVVDDNKAAATMLKMVVKMLGNEVRTAHDGQQAVEVAAEFLPDVVLMDLGMPKMNGYEAARHIREQPWGRDMLLVALTGWGQDEDRERTQEAGFDHHLVKPAEPAALQELLANHQPKTL